MFGKDKLRELDALSAKTLRILHPVIDIKKIINNHIFIIALLSKSSK
tara:strand:- start:752 stop:892 length:141 start_codon:yes stop_codon:yes gene_type:complete